ncbi:MAG: nitrile hydratase subunit alpha [Alphaproteobacteria bacterium]|nr:nitrile hydratase subunit alpha [Alphaproteobacteria bacterium]
MNTEPHDHDDGHDDGHGDGHDHEHDDHAPTREDDDIELTEREATFLALKSLLIEQGIVTAEEIRKRMEFNERGSPHQAARMIAKAWLDPHYKTRMIDDTKAAAAELGIETTEAELVTLENTPDRHNIVVCTLCSCYPRSLLGEPPAFYVSKAYRSRAVREPRQVLKEFGVDIPQSVDIAVHDSNADLRYVVMPMRPAGTDAMSEAELAALISRDCVVGCALPSEPGGN